MIYVEVAYATPEKQTLLTLSVPEKSTVEQAIIQSGILTQIAELADVELNELKIGIFSIPCVLEKTLEMNDRIEIYRPLQNDPKDARRQRALKK